MWNTETLVIAGLVFLLAGFVKGVIGLGLPTVSLALLTATIGLKAAMALLIVPSIVTNVWQGVVGGALGRLLRRLGAFLVLGCVGTWIGIKGLTVIDTTLLSALLGVLLVVYAAAALTRARLPAVGGRERWLGPVVGAVNGVLTGLTGSFVVPGVMYLQALGLSRDELVQAMGIAFTVSTLALAAGLSDQRLISAELGAVSAAGVVPAVLGMVIGQRLRRRMSEAAFQKAFFLALLALGAYIVFRSLAAYGVGAG